MDHSHDILVRKLEKHTALSPAEIELLRGLPVSPRIVKPGEDLVRQGDQPKVSIVVLNGMVGRYHTLRGGGRQYLSFHIAGDWPDAQTLFIDRMDHSVAAISGTAVVMITHRDLLALFERCTTVAFAVWRETLIDASIFREAITNNSRRDVPVRLAHFLCEQYYRAKAAGLAESGVCDLPLSQTQLADALASSLTTISRAFRSLRSLQAFELKNGQLSMRNWARLAEYGEFDATYLHLREPPQLPTR